MGCEEALELLSAALDGEITPAQQVQLDEHLAQCPACRALQAELLGIHEALGALETPAPAGLKAQIMASLPPQTSRTRAVYWRRWCAMAACAALVVLGVWQLPRVILNAGRSADTAAATVYDAPMADSAEAVAIDGGAIPTALNDEADLPPYVEGDGVSVNAAPAPQPDPSGASYAVFGYNTTEAPSAFAGAAAPQAVDDLAADIAPTALRKFDLRNDKALDPLQTGGASAPVVPAAGAEEENGVYATEEAALELPAPEAVPEFAISTTANEDSTQSQQFLVTSATKAAPEASAAPDAPVELEDPFASYCGILTVDQYEPSGGDYSVEFWENGLRQYILSAADLQALVAQLDSQGAAYELTAEGEGIDPEALCGLVIVTGQPPQVSPEAP